MQSQTQIRQQITQQIIAALEQDLVPWRRPWSVSKNVGRPANVLSRRAYSGINPLLLELHALEHGFQSRWWGTFHQWKQLGGTVQKRPSHIAKGEWGCKIVFYRPICKTTIDPATGEQDEDKFLVMRTWSVFNAEQVDGDAIEPFRTIEEPTAGEFPDFTPADELIKATQADIRYGSDKAFYSRPTPYGSFPNHTDGDFVVLPHCHQFPQPGAFYETAFHELAHWSELRLGWDYDRQGYAAGELVAEMASCFVAQELGIPDGEDLLNHATYIKGWLKSMRDDAGFVFKGATQASKTADYLLSFVQQPEPAAVV
jgi:antirestriction protein ArdC